MSETRTGLSAGEIRQAFLDKLRCALGRPRIVFSSDRSIRDYCAHIRNINTGIV